MNVRACLRVCVSCVVMFVWVRRGEGYAVARIPRAVGLASYGVGANSARVQQDAMQAPCEAPHIPTLEPPDTVPNTRPNDA